MCPAFRQSKVLAHGQEIKMPQGVSVVSTATESEGSLTALNKQHLSFTLLCRWGILCKTTAAFLTGSHRQGWRLTQWEQLRAACRFCNLLSPFWCGYTFFSALCVILTGTFISSAWRRALLLEAQCFRFLPFSREAGSDNPIFYNAIPFKSSNGFDTQQKELFHLYSKTVNQLQNLRGRGAEGYPIPQHTSHSWEISYSCFCRWSIKFTIYALWNS